MYRFFFSKLPTLIFIMSFATQAQLVSTNTELNSAISNAIPGSIIILTNGIWTNTQINITKIGTEANPIIIKAQTAGAVFFEGNSNVKMGGSYVYFEGVIFRNPSGISTGTPIISFKGSSTECQYCRLTNVKIDSYNGISSQSTSTFKWVLLYGNNNEISFCSFLGKYGVGSIINDNRDSNSSVPDYSKIHHNYFAGRRPVGEINALNDQDAIRIGWSGTSLTDSFTEVYDNYFNDFSGEIEIISNKSCGNKYYNNTFRDYNGCLTLRHGNNCEVFNNFFIANNKLFSGGVRVMGENHKVYNNYIEGVNSLKPDGTTSSAVGGINVTNGRINSALNGYLPVKNTTIINNTFVNCDFGFRIGTNVGGDLTIAPENLIIANNLIVSNSTSAKAIDQQAIPTGILSKYEGNMRQRGTWDITSGSNGNKVISTELLANSKTDYFRLITGSAAIDANIGVYPFLNRDISGGTRTFNFDVGAEELNSNGTDVPYLDGDVGVKIGFIPDSSLGVVDHSIQKNNILTIYPVPVSGDYLNLSYSDTLGLVKIVDMQSKIVFEKVLDCTTAKINLSGLSKGVYFVKVKNSIKIFNK